MRVASLFTGAGGLDLGLKQAGHEIILQCEHDPGAQQVLKHNFPGVLLVPDVCGLQSLPKGTELLAAGFPCIDISRAGLRKGFQGQSSGLVQHVFRLLEDAIEKKQPVPWVLLENVEALLDRAPNGGSPFVKSVTDSLEVLGYQSWAHRVIGTAGFGVPNRRTRVFIVASLHGDARDVLLAQGQQQCVGSCCPDGFHDQNAMPCFECYQEKVKWKTAKEVSFALDLGNARSAPGLDVVPTFTTSNDRMCLLLSSGRMGMLRIEDAERLQGFPVGFTQKCYPIHPPGLNSHKQRPVKDSEVDIWESKRFALLGNAVTVQVGRWIGERLAAPYSQKYIPSDRDMPMTSEFRNQHLKGMRKAPTIYDGLMSEFEPLDGGLLVRGTKTPVYNTVFKEGEANGNAGSSEEDSTTPVESNQTMKKEFHGRKEMQSDAWPRAAWYIRGMGRFGVEEMSECPVKFPFTPLGPFISEVGKLPGNDVINTYIMRLREQGWNVEGVINKATKCGVNLEKEVASVVRLEGAPDDPDQISNLVWTQCPVNKMPWPAEMLDPLNLPPTRSIPTQAVEKLTREQKRTWLQRDLWHPEDAIGGNLAHGALDENVKTEEQDDRSGRRKVLVVFFGDNCFNWVLPEDVLDFADNLAHKEAEARKLHEANLLKRPTLFFRALDEAKTWLVVKTRKRTRGAKYVSAVSARAAQLAAAENRKPRCGNCEACLNRHSGGLQRRCLTVRAHAAAMGGHAGAQLAVYRERAIGARVHVYWPLDQQWYTGTLTDYDRIRLRHTITYDDGDREMIPLWSPCQLIRVINTPKEWQAKAVEIGIESEKAKELEKEKSAQRKNSRKDESRPGGMMDGAQLTQLEMDREANIKRNQALLDSIMGEKGSKGKNAVSSSSNGNTDVDGFMESDGKGPQDEAYPPDSSPQSEQTTRVGLKRTRSCENDEEAEVATRARKCNSNPDA